jgi:hypothetical protein
LGANVDFWVDEARHCLDVIAGYEKRFRAMRTSTASHDASHGHDWTIDSRVTKSTKSHDRNVAKTRVTEVARRFLRRCEKTGDLDQATVIALCERLAVNYPP